MTAVTGQGHLDRYLISALREQTALAITRLHETPVSVALARWNIKRIKT